MLLHMRHTNSGPQTIVGPSAMLGVLILEIAMIDKLAMV